MTHLHYSAISAILESSVDLTQRLIPANTVQGVKNSPYFWGRKVALKRLSSTFPFSGVSLLCAPSNGGLSMLRPASRVTASAGGQPLSWESFETADGVAKAALRSERLPGKRGSDRNDAFKGPSSFVGWLGSLTNRKQGKDKCLKPFSTRSATSANSAISLSHGNLGGRSDFALKAALRNLLRQSVNANPRQK